MKLIFPIITILFITLSSCSSSDEFNRKSNKKAKKMMSFHLKKLNLYSDILYGDNIDTTKSVTFRIDESVMLYESISLVKSYREYQKEMFITPLKYNISDWNEFYNLNKDNVYLDKNKIIKFKTAPIYLDKNPVDYLNSFIKELENMILEKNIHAQEFDFIEEKLEIVTKLECNDNDYDFEDSNKCMIDWKNWIKENSSKLYWNKGAQEVIVKY